MFICSVAHSRKSEAHVESSADILLLTWALRANQTFPSYYYYNNDNSDNDNSGNKNNIRHTNDKHPLHL